MKKQIIKSIACIAMVFTFAGCTKNPNTTAQKDRKQPVAISISRNGTLSVAGEQCRQSELAARLTALAARQQPAIVIRADAGAPYMQVVAVLDACETAGVRQVSLATTR